MAYETLDNRNMSEGLQVLFLYANDVTSGLLMNLFVVGFFLVTLFASYFSVQRTSGFASFPVSFAVAGFVTAIMSILLSLVDGLIPTYTLLVSIVVAVIGVLWVYLDSR